MSLKIFHIVFVTCSSGLCFLIGSWSIAQGSGAGSWVMAALCFVLGVALVVYGFWFWRKITTPEEEMRRRRKLFRTVQMVTTKLVAMALAITALLVGSSTPARACSVCYGEAGGPMIEAAQSGVLFLVGVIFAVQAALIIVFLSLRRRLRRINGPVDPWWTDVKESLES